MPLKAYKMKKLYATNKALLSNKNLYPFLIMAILLISTVYSSYGQVRVPFTPRTSSTTPTTTVYNVKGDFTMIGNTNLTLLPPLYTNTANNNNDMQYVDIDGTAVPGNNTFNSSSAFLDFSTENSAIPECSNIIYAGLYWTGRARSGTDDNADGDNNPNTFQVTKNGITKFFDKQKVSIKGPSSASYIPLTANASDIYYPDGIDGNMYSAYTEITDYVIQNGIGDYFVADIATVEGNGGNIGYYGGWGMVVVYENSKMKWRDITVFDGHAYVPSSTTSYDIPVNGFNSVQNGDVNLKLGLMAGEGDVGVSGDYFEIQRQIDGTFQRLSHTGNTTGNFFNSSITNTNRAPNLLNNTGVDIAMFNIDNTGNAIIDNNQTSTVLRYGSTEDTYIIFNVTFSVDAYIPETQGVLTNTSIDGSPPGPGNTTLEPSEDADYAIEIKNTGTEAINNTVITVPIPAAINPTNLNINYNIYPPLTSTTNPNIPFYDPSIGANGSIVWNLGTLPVPANPDVVLADISFSLTVTTDCTVLNDPSFDPNVEVNGNISGVGAISNISFDTPLIQGFQTDGLCQGEPIPTPSIIEIDYVDFINEGPTASNPDPINVECIEDVPAPDVTVVTDEADNQGIPVVAFVGDSSDGNTCPEVITRTYSVTDDCGNSIEVEQTITINPVTVPVVPADDSATVECLDDATQPTAPVVTDVCGNDITPVITQNADPTCEGDKIYTFTYIDCAGNSSVYTFTYTIDLLIFTLPANGIETVDNLADATTPTPPTVNDNCGNSIAPTGPTVSTTPDCQGSVVYTYTYTDCAGNTADWTYTYTIELAPFTVPADDSSTVECLGDATAPTPPTVFDANGDEVVPTMTENTDPICEGDKIYTFTYTDCAGNTADWLYTYTIDIVTAPVVPANGSATVECLDDATQPTAPVVTDVCGNDIIPVITQNADPVCEGDKIYTFTYTDCTGNSSVYTYTYTIDLSIFTLPANGIETVDNLADATTPTPPTVNDNCGVSITPTGPTVSATPDCQGSVVYTYTYTDCAGNTADWTYTYTIELAPFTVPADDSSTVECLGDATAPTPPTVFDANGDEVVPTMTENTDPICEGDKIYTFTYTDCAGNTADWLYTYTIDIVTAPVVPANGSATVECLDDATQPTAPVVTDVCGNDITPVITQNADPTCEGDKIYTFTYTDCAGNSSVYTFTYTIDIVTAPVVPANDSATVECLDDATQPNAPVVADVCGNSLTAAEPIITDTPNPLTCEITRTYDFTYTDCAGNSSIYTFTYNVIDTTAPVLSLPANVTAECSDDLSPIAFGTATATDNCDPDPVITFNDLTTDGLCPGSFTITRTWIATDVCGNFTEVDQIISTSDTTAPEFVETLPQDFTIECNSVPEPDILTATDNCSSATVEVNDTRTDGNCPNNYVITRVYTATDECGNPNSHVQTITVQDITPPTFVEPLPAVNLVVECDAVPDAETLTATDTCGSASVSVEDVITDGNCENNYTIARTWTATDECGLTTVHTQIITVQDTTPPTFVDTLPGDLTVECDSIPDAGRLTATDNCGDAIVEVNDVRTDGDCPNNYVILRTWTATDACGLMTAHTQTITVQDTTAPVPTSTFDETLNVSCTDVPDAPELEFTDNCSSNVIVVFNETNSFDENVLVDYEIVRTWTVRDACNNEDVYTQTLFVALDEVITEITVEDRCYDDGIVNLNDFTGGLNTNGIWEILEGDMAATLNNDGIFDPSGLELSETFLPEDGGIDYKFRYTTTDSGCISITEITMNINADCVVLPCGENDIEISKALTPNGDLINDFFYISGIDLCGFTAGVKIFNRWGALVFESNSYPLVNAIEKNLSPPSGSWEGNAHKSSIGASGKVPNGTYYYIITLKDSGLNPITGPVYLGTK